ncbi:DUF4131 domain-containing protein, partial [Patescibacteria group bacterium]|nr:DUF4131 domain-containing protein [Patescibacteria group bacterium]
MTFLFIVFWGSKTILFFLLCILFVMVGFGRYLIAFPTDSTKNISNLSGKQKIVGYVATEPDVRMDGVRYIVQSQEFIANSESREVAGRIYLKSALYPRYSYGDRLEMDCEIEKPEPIEAVEGTSQRDFR